MRGDEVLQHGHALAEVGAHGDFDDAAGGVGHEPAHAAELADVALVAARPRAGHHGHRALGVEAGHHRFAHPVGGVLPDVHHAGVALVLGDEAALVLPVDLVDTLVSLLEQVGLLLPRHLDVVDGDGHAALGGVAEADGLDAVDEVGGLVAAEHLVAVADHLAQGRAGHGPVGALAVAQPRRHDLVEDEPTDGRLDGSLDEVARLDVPCGHLLDAHRGVQAEPAHAVVGQLLDAVARVDATELVGQQRVAVILEGGHRCAVGPGGVHGQVVAAQDHVLRRRHHRRPVGGREEVRRREHHLAGLVLGGLAERHVHGHLVAVEVGVEGEADERVDLDRRALDELGHERLDAQAVQRGRAVEQHGMVLDDVLEDVPDDLLDALHEPLGALDVVRVALLDQLAHDEGLEQLESHLLGQPALVQLEVRADHDDRAARVVHALAQQVLAEAALLALEHVGQALQAVVARAGDGAAATAVVDERVTGLLQHALLVADDDLRRAQLEQPLEAVVAVDDAAVQVVEVGGGEAAAVELHHRPQVGRDDREHRDGSSTRGARRSGGRPR